MSSLFSLSSTATSILGLAIDSSGNVYTSTAYSVYQWTADSGSFGTLVAPNFDPGPSRDQRNPMGVGVDTAGDVYFAWGGSRDIYRLRASDGSLASIGTLGVPPGFWFSTWLAVGTSGDCYVSTYSVWFRTNLDPQEGGWILLGPATIVAPGQFQFHTAPTSRPPSGFYRVRSP